MIRRTAITVNRSREEVQRLWQSSEHRQEQIDHLEAAVTFVEAPGDRGTEIHVDFDPRGRAGKVGEMIRKAFGSEPLAKVRDELRRFKQRVETGVIPRSEGSPEGELAGRKRKQRPAQPLSESELEKAGT